MADADYHVWSLWSRPNKSRLSSIVSLVSSCITNGLVLRIHCSITGFMQHDLHQNLGMTPFHAYEDCLSYLLLPELPHMTSGIGLTGRGSCFIGTAFAAAAAGS